MKFKGRMIVSLGIWALVLVGLGYLFSSILGYLLISLVLSTMLKPVVNWLVLLRIYKARIPRAVAVLMSFMLVFTVLGAFLLLLAPLVVDQMTMLRKVNFDEILYSFEGSIKSMEGFLIRNHFVEEEMGFIKNSVKISTLLNSSGVGFSEVLNQVISVTSSFFISALAVLFISFSLLYENGILKRLVLGFVPNAYFELTATAMFKIEKMLTSYLVGLLMQLSGIFTMTAIGLSIVGVKYAVTVAVFSAVMTIVPYVGPLAGNVLAVLVGLSTAPLGTTQDQYLWLMASIVGVGLTVQFIDDFITQPLIFSSKVSAHPLAIFMAVFAGASLGGPVGMIVAIPALTTLKVIVEELIKGFDRYHIFTLAREYESPGPKAALIRK